MRVGGAEKLSHSTPVAELASAAGGIPDQMSTYSSVGRGGKTVGLFSFYVISDLYL